MKRLYLVTEADRAAADEYLDLEDREKLILAEKLIGMMETLRVKLPDILSPHCNDKTEFGRVVVKELLATMAVMLETGQALAPNRGRKGRLLATASHRLRR